MNLVPKQGCPARNRSSLLLWLLLFPALPLHAEVSAVADNGFISRHELLLEADPRQAWQALTAEVARWWDPAHSYAGSAANFTLEARAGGCFCEALPDGGSVMHMQVVYAAPAQLLRLTGGLGPLQGMGVSGAMTFALEPTADGRTLLRYQYVVSGYSPAGLAGLAEPVDLVQRGQLERLAAYLAGQRF